MAMASSRILRGGLHLKELEPVEILENSFNEIQNAICHKINSIEYISKILEDAIAIHINSNCAKFHQD